MYFLLVRSARNVEAAMRKFLFFLTASPYSGQTAATALNLARAALEAGHQSTIFATGDGVYGFMKGQKTAGVFDVGAAVEDFLASGGTVDL
jgi:sulfur relay (sulfurtransferase) complex TusBCD TusD component (DsrE family)